MSYETFYAALDKPFFAPEPWVFGFAWGIIYPLIAIAFVYTIYLVWKKQLPKGILLLFLINLIANALFTPLQLQLPGSIFATLDIFIILGTLLGLTWFFYKNNTFLFYILLPYLGWVAFATLLQSTIYVLNFL